MVLSLDENGVVEEITVTWGSLVVISEKPHQDNVPCHEYQRILCVYYQKLNQAACPFAFPVPHCGGAVQYIDTESKYFIALDIDSGYFQVVL